MMVNLSVWETISALAGLIGFFVGALGVTVRLMIRQYTRALDQRFDLIERARTEAQVHWNMRIEGLERHVREEPVQWEALRKEMGAINAQLPVEYVRREDWIRFSAGIDAKMDSLGGKIDRIGERLRISQKEAP